MITKNISTLKVQKLTQDQYEAALANGIIDDDSMYLTPIEVQDYALKSDLEMIGKLSNLKTNAKSSIVDAINEIFDLLNS